MEVIIVIGYIVLGSIVCAIQKYLFEYSDEFEPFDLMILIGWPVVILLSLVYLLSYISYYLTLELLKKLRI